MEPTTEMLFRLALGAVYGGAIGFERQINGRPAGFRTHIVVCVASVLLMELSEGYQHLSSMNPDYVRLDPGRIAAGAITGIGFIGAGVIIKMGANVLGLTTAASLWMVSAIGFSVGAGMYISSAGAFVITAISLFALRFIERVTPSIIFKSLTIKSDIGVNEFDLKDILNKYNVKLYRTDYEVDNAEGTFTMFYTVTIRRKSHIDDMPIKAMMDEIAALDKVRKVSVRM